MGAGRIFTMAGMWTMWIWTLKVVRVFQLGINNNCYCCLHYPISYVLVSVLQSLLSDRKSSLSQNLYKMSQQIDAKLRKVGQDKTIIKISQNIHKSHNSFSATKTSQFKPAADKLNWTNQLKLTYHSQSTK